MTNSSNNLKYESCLKEINSKLEKLEKRIDVITNELFNTFSSNSDWLAYNRIKICFIIGKVRCIYDIKDINDIFKYYELCICLNKLISLILFNKRI